MARKFQNPKLETRSDVKRPYYFVRLTVSGPDGKRRRVPRALGFLDEISHKEAMKRRAEAIEVANAGKLLVQAQVRFRDLVARYRQARLPQLAVPTQKTNASHIDRHLLPAFGDKRLCDIDRAEVEAFFAGKAEKYSWWTRNGMRAVLSAIFAAARDWNLWTGESPTVGIRIGRKRVVRERRHITSQQMQAILASVSDTTRLMILIALCLGLRISEVLGLKWRDIDLEAGKLAVRQRWYRGDLDEPKTEASKNVRQLGPLVEEFKRRYPGPQARECFVFLGEDGVTPPDEREILRWELRPALKRLKVYYPGLGWHQFRRQNVTWRQTLGGAAPIEAQRNAGHASLDMTLLYSLTDEDRDRSQVQAIMDELTGLPGGLKQ